MLSTVSFLVAIGFGLIIPAIPIFASSFGVNKTAIGLIVSAFAVMRFSSGLVSGKLVDRFGERAVLGFGLFMVSFFTLLTALSQSYSQLLIFRTLGGLGSSMFSVSAGSLLMRSVGDDVRARAQSLYNGGFLVGGVAGPAFGGILSGVSLRAPFFVYSITLALAGATALFSLSEKRLGKKVDIPSNQIENTSLKEAFRLRPYQIALILAFVNNWVLFGMRSSILPIFVTEKLNSTASIAGLGLTIGALLQGIFLLRAGRFSDESGRKAALLVGSTVVMSAILVLCFTTNVTLYFISMALFGLGGAYVGTAPGSVVGDIIRGRGGQVIAAWQMAGDAGMIVGPILVGFLTDVYSFQVAFIASAIVYSSAIFLAFILPETRQSKLGFELIPDKNKQEL
ncbi:MAG: MFS transporter [Actinobacteria bacterium]|nr:MFS transporter [Actinomycetota bacterium]MSX69192.1 MFS transporter [Actinomycetota bacterium]MSY15585.1 MFS transporter [Actinomycetota bacterium]MSY65134.1 MFS transporter [Actinomycetota bacterium]MTA98406.1 MFS transporter [Actinomycetota bacterium]